MQLSQVSSRAAGPFGVRQLAAALGPARRKSAQPPERRRQAAALLVGTDTEAKGGPFPIWET